MRNIKRDEGVGDEAARLRSGQGEGRRRRRGFKGRIFLLAGLGFRQAVKWGVGLEMC